MTIQETEVPPGALIAQYAQAEAHYADCFVTAGQATLPAFIEAFYTTALFKAERLVLRYAARAPSTDAEAAALAQGQAEEFAVWTVAARTETEILLQDRSGRTMSWLSVADGLAFGSVVVPVRGRFGKLTLGPVFHSLVGPHKAYSRALLASAAARLRRQTARARSS